MSASSSIAAVVAFAALLLGCAAEGANREWQGYLQFVRTEGAEASWRGWQTIDRVSLNSGRSLSLTRRDPAERWASGIDALVLENAGGGIEWRIGQPHAPLSPQGYLIPGDCITVLERGDRVIIVSWHSVATGALVTLLDSQTGAVLWQRSALALGDITHSRYSNRVTAAATDDAVVVWGREAGGDYLDVIGFDGEVRQHRRL